MIAESPHATARGEAMWAEAKMLGNALRHAESLAGDAMTAEQRKGYTEFLGTDTVPWLQDLDATATAARREQLLDLVANVQRDQAGFAAEVQRLGSGVRETAPPAALVKSQRRTTLAGQVTPRSRVAIRPED